MIASLYTHLRNTELKLNQFLYNRTSQSLYYANANCNFPRGKYSMQRFSKLFDHRNSFHYVLLISHRHIFRDPRKEWKP